MEVSSSHQLTVFGIYVLSGFLCGTFFDVQRIFRRMFKADVTRTSIEDLLFAAFTVFMTIAPGYIYNDGEMRYYQVIGILCGGIIYAVVLSRIVTKILQFTFCFAGKSVITPVLKILRIFIVPFKKMFRKIKSVKTIRIRMKKKLFRHFRRKKKTIEKRIKML